MKIAFYGSSLLSSYWNGAATYYRGMLADLARRGYEITFYEPDAFDRQKHRDMDPPDWAEVRVYPATEEAVRGVLAEAAQADVVVKASGVGVFDDELLEGVVAASKPEAIRIFWDVGAPAELAGTRAARRGGGGRRRRRVRRRAAGGRRCGVETRGHPDLLGRGCSRDAGRDARPPGPRAPPRTARPRPR